MNKPYKRSLRVALSVLPLLTTQLYAQTPTIYIAKWKDNAKAAYTLIHDDFGDPSAVGIAQHADTIAYNRGVKFSFGAITSECDSNDWADARRLMSHGHEIINHAHSHLCSHQPGWCTAGLYTPADFAVELDGSTTLIEQGTGYRPRFFVHPFDLSTPEVLARLKTLEYLGARSGAQNVINNSDFKDFFNLNYYVNTPATQLFQLNEAVQAAIISNGYTMWEMHGVADGSWGSVSIANYRAHLDYVKSQIASGNLWSATASEAISYKIQRDAYKAAVVADTAGKKITIRFTGTRPSTAAMLKSPITLNVNLNGLKLVGKVSAKQGSDSLAVKIEGGQIVLHAYPHKGNIVISAPTVTGCAPNCPPPAPVICDPNGKLKVDHWNLVLRNWKLSDLTGDSTIYPNQPTSTTTINAVTLSGEDAGDSYAERISGYIVPTASGEYSFAVTGDDDVELYLSTDDKPANKRKIAGFTGFTGIAEFTKFAGQKSAKINLQANKFYYVEVLHLGTTGTNRCDVYWQKPGLNNFVLMDKTVIGSELCTNAPTVQPRLTLNGARTGQAALLNWATQQVDEKTPYTVERLEANGRYSTIGTARSHDFSDETPMNGVNIYRIRYTDAYGQTRHSEPVKINFTENPNVYLAPNPATQAVSIDLREWNQAAVTIYLYDVRGAEMQRVTTVAGDAPYTLDLTKIQQTGQYMIRVQSADGRAVAKRLMIAE
jgi:peptidoglycan/xylan/chitin deacetylase (PgdA/CDA1 family)